MHVCLREKISMLFFAYKRRLSFRHDRGYNLDWYDKYPYYSKKSDLNLPIRKPTTHDYQSKNRLILKIKYKYFLIKTNYVYYHEKTGKYLVY